MQEYDLSIKNLSDIENIYISKKNKKAKILMIGASHILGWKVFEILKRDYAVVAIQEDGCMEELENISLQDEQRIQAYIIYQQIQTIVISSEFLENCAGNENGLDRLLDYAGSRGIRLIYLFVHRILEATEERSIIRGLKCEDRRYIKEGMRLKERVRGAKGSLIIELDCCYGFSGALKKWDFLGAVKKIRQTCPELLDELPEEEVCPVLADEVGLWLVKHFQDEGCFYLKGRERIPYREWGQESGQVWKEADGYKPYEERREERFSSLAEGSMVEGHQKECVFNLVYKYSHHESVKGENIGAFRYRLGSVLVQSIPEDIRNKIDFVTPVPRTGMYYAMGLAAGLSVPYIQAIDKTSSKLRSFQITSADVRKEILWDKLRTIPALLEGKTVAVVDEAIFTGTTLKVVCEMFRECKVNKIYLCIPTPRCRYHCDYLVLPKRDMLMEYVNESMLTEYFDVEGIFFQDDQRFLEETQTLGDICADCFWGRNLK